MTKVNNLNWFQAEGIIKRRGRNWTSDQKKPDSERIMVKTLNEGKTNKVVVRPKVVKSLVKNKQ